MQYELNQRALYPMLAGIVFDLASIREVVKRTRLRVSGRKGREGKTEEEKHRHLSVCYSLFSFFLYTSTIVIQE